MDRDFLIKLPGQVTVGQCKLMKFIALGEAVGKVKNNKEFGEKAIKRWENLSKGFAHVVMSRRLFSSNSAHTDEAQYESVFCFGYSPSIAQTLHYIIQQVQIIR